MTLPGVYVRFAAVAAAVLGAAASIAGGPARTAAADPCPDVEIVFARGTSEPPGIGSVGSAPALPAATARNVVAVAVFGNPAAKFGNPLSTSGLFAGSAIDVCGDGDPICSPGRNPSAHTGYETSPYIDQAVSFVAPLV